MRVYVLLMIFAQLIASVSQLLLKKAALKYGGDTDGGESTFMKLVRQYLNALVIGGYALLMVSMFISIVCYGGMDYMYVVIIEPVSYIMVMLLARLFYKEKLTARKLLGMCLILTGILVFYIQR